MMEDYEKSEFEEHIKCGQECMEKGDYSESESSFVSALLLCFSSDDENEALARLNLGVLYTYTGDYGKACSYLGDVLRIFPNNALARKTLEYIRQVCVGPNLVHKFVAEKYLGYQ